MAKISQRKEGRNPLICVVGPTASGKSDLGVQLAKKFNGEIISVDSRQVYKGLDLGSGKITAQEMQGVPHHLLDVASPKRRFSVAQYQKKALKAIAQIQKRGTLPFLVGGSPLYIYSVVDGISFPAVKPNSLSRSNLDRLSTHELFVKLQKLDPERAKTLQQSSGQARNRRRLIRALEIVMTTGKPVPKLKQKQQFDSLIFGVNKSYDELKKRIEARLKKRLKQGMVAEAKNIHDSGVSWKKLESFGLEYRYIAQYLQNKISHEHMQELIIRDSLRLVKKQMQWLKKDLRIHWISTYKQAENLLTLRVNKS